ncbi:MAG TPA: TrkH family potassium uptake protein [Cyclobacteriaceae bacterium]|nr:TrkH family potassium uptake protein [Cyclobacteriaceae bacterium]
MRLNIIIRYIGTVLLFNSVFLFISLLISIYHHENSIVPLLYGTLICILFGIFPLIFVPPASEISVKEGLSIVVSGWFVTTIAGSLPYILWGGEFTLINAWFESVSGYTTTGSSILIDVEALPKGLLFWRSSTNYIGGVGIILFTFLILPQSANTKLVLFNTEMSELAKNNFQYMAKQTIRILAVVYAGLTLIEIVLLLFTGMPLFDAINHSFCTIATGGFSIKNASLGFYNNVWSEIIITVFMIVSGVHFGLLFDTVVFKKYNIFRSSIVRWYLIVLITGILLSSTDLYFNHYGSFLWALRYASFNIASVGTTTGFATMDTAGWPPLTLMIIIYLSIQGACVGTTVGGIKFDRVFVIVKMIGKQMKSMLHPRGVFPVKIDHRTLTEQVENHTAIYIITYLLIIAISTILLTMMKVDLLTSFTGTIATLGNVGPGLGKVSSMGNFSGIPDLGKLVYIFNMMLGRLEIFSILTIFIMKKY